MGAECSGETVADGRHTLDVLRGEVVHVERRGGQPDGVQLDGTRKGIRADAVQIGRVGEQRQRSLLEFEQKGGVEGQLADGENVLVGVQRVDIVTQRDGDDEQDEGHEADLHRLNRRDTNLFSRFSWPVPRRCPCLLFPSAARAAMFFSHQLANVLIGTDSRVDEENGVLIFSPPPDNAISSPLLSSLKNDESNSVDSHLPRRRRRFSHVIRLHCNCNDRERERADGRSPPLMTMRERRDGKGREGKRTKRNSCFA